MQRIMMRRVFPILALCVFSSTLGVGIVAPLLPLYVQEMGATGIWLGAIVAAYFASNSIVVPIAGRLSDVKGRRLFLAFGLLAYSLFSIGYIFATDVSHLILVRFLQGIAGAMTVPIAMAYIGDLSPEGEEGKWQGYANAAFFSGFGFGPLIGGIVTDHLGMTASFLILVGLNFFAFCVALLFLPETGTHHVPKEGRTSFRTMSKSNMIKGLFSFRMAQALGRGGIGTFLPIFAAAMGLSTSLIGLLIALNILSVTLFTPVGGYFADKLNRRTLTVSSSIVFTLLLASIPLADSFWILLVIMLAQGLSGAISMPAASALIVEEGRKFGMGSTMSVFFLAMSIGQAIGPLVTGGIVDLFDVNSAFYFGGILGLIGTFLFFIFTREYKGNTVIR